jgi:hypothetical protein
MKDLHEFQLSLFDNDEDIIFYKNGVEIGRGAHTILITRDFNHVSRVRTGECDE